MACDALYNTEEHKEHGQIDQERKAAIERVDAVLLVEGYQLSFIFCRSSLYRSEWPSVPAAGVASVAWNACSSR